MGKQTQTSGLPEPSLAARKQPWPFCRLLAVLSPFPGPEKECPPQQGLGSKGTLSSPSLVSFWPSPKAHTCRSWDVGPQLGNLGMLGTPSLNL